MAPSYALSTGEAQPHGPHRRAVGSVGASYSRSTSKRRWTRQALARPTRCPERHLVDTSHRSALEGSPRTLSSLPDLPSALPEVDRRRSSWQRTRSSSRRPRRARADRPLRVLHRRHVRRSQKRGACVGKTKRGKGTKLMAFSDSSCVPLALHTERVLARTKSPLSPIRRSGFSFKKLRSRVGPTKPTTPILWRRLCSMKASR